MHYTTRIHCIPFWNANVLISVKNVEIMRPIPPNIFTIWNPTVYFITFKEREYAYGILALMMWGAS